MEGLSLTGLRAAYRRYAPVYDWVFGPSLEAGRRQMAQVIRDHGAQRVLEVGVGTGLALPGYPEGAHVVGIDISEEMLERARTRADGLDHISVELMSMDAENMSLPDASFDCVSVPYVLSATPNPDQLMSELRRVCKPGGLIVLLNHFSGTGSWRWAERLLARSAARVGFHSEFDYEHNVVRHGLDIREVRPVNLMGLSRLVVMRNQPAAAA